MLEYAPAPPASVSDETKFNSLIFSQRSNNVRPFFHLRLYPKPKILAKCCKFDTHGTFSKGQIREQRFYSSCILNFARYVSIQKKCVWEVLTFIITALTFYKKFCRKLS